MARKCPKCGSITLDYDPNEDMWICVRAKCNYSEPNKEEDALKKSIFGIEKEDNSNKDPKCKKCSYKLACEIIVLENYLIAEDSEELKKLYKEASEKFGNDLQMYLLFEEIGELISSICKFKRKRVNTEKISEEIADLELMLGETKFLFRLNEKIEKIKKEKIERLKKRLKEKFKNVSQKK